MPRARRRPTAAAPTRRLVRRAMRRPPRPGRRPSAAARVTLPTGFPERPFVRVQRSTRSTWRPTEGNTLGVQTAVVEGDPSKPGYYLTINHFPKGVMSRPHYHPDERYVIVLRGTWHTDEGERLPARGDGAAEAGRLHAASEGRAALRRRARRRHLGGDQRLRPDEGHRHGRRRAVRPFALRWRARCPHPGFGTCAAPAAAVGWPRPAGYAFE